MKLDPPAKAPTPPGERDLVVCREVIRAHSRSFHAASRLLPPRVRDAAVATYAFCRGADDDVDGASSEAAARLCHRRTRARLARLYDGLAEPAPGATASGDPEPSGTREAAVDRAFAWVVRSAAIPREEPEALLEGMAQDLGTVRLADRDALLLYGYRAAGVVGRMMSRIMGCTGAEALRRAVDLGIAMQLTNVARDVGEDALRGRVYLPATWLEEAGSSPEEVLEGRPRAAILAVNRRVLRLAEGYYASGIAGVRLLPPSCRPAILSAALLYRAIGRRVAARGGDGITSRARVGGAAKLGLVGAALVRCALDPGLRGSTGRAHDAALHAPLRRVGVHP